MTSLKYFRNADLPIKKFVRPSHLNARVPVRLASRTFLCTTDWSAVTERLKLSKCCRSALMDNKWTILSEAPKSLTIFHLDIMTALKRYLDIFYEHRCAVKFAPAIVQDIVNNNTRRRWCIVRCNKAVCAQWIVGTLTIFRVRYHLKLWKIHLQPSYFWNRQGNSKTRKASGNHAH